MIKPSAHNREIASQMKNLPSIFRPSRSKPLISLLTIPTNLPLLYHTFSLSLLQTHTQTNHFDQILSHAITSNRFDDPFVSSKLLHHSLSSPAITLHFSRTLFFQIQNPNVYAWNFILRAYSQSPFPEETIDLYNQMRRNGVSPDDYSFPFVLKACGRLSCFEKALEVHCSSVKLGFDFDVFVQNAVIHMYFQCGFGELAWKAFNWVPSFVGDAVTWNSMISGCLQSGHSYSALKVFDEMLRRSDVRPNDVTLVSVTAACARIGSLDLGRRVHGLSVVNGFVLDAYLGSSLIDLYTKCGQAEDAKKVFERITKRNVVCWTSIIAGYVKLDLFKEAIDLFRGMQLSGTKADSATIACIVSACGNLGALDQGRWVLAYAEKNGIEINLTVNNALIDMYSKCGEIGKALEIFHGLAYKDVFSWSAIIRGLAMNVQPHRALHLFSCMETSGDVKPNEVTFLGVLCACSHGGFVNEGFHYLNSMSRRYNLIPRIEHYGCIVDLLGRANLLVEAEKLISSIPIDPDAVMWRSLLFACRSHGNIELAELAAKKLEELLPQGPGANLLLSSVYASASRWSDARRVRGVRTFERNRKEPGCSFVEIDGIVHEFFVADDSHHNGGDIYEAISGVNKIIRSEVLDLCIFD